MPLHQNPHQTVARFGCIGCINICVRVFCDPEATILLVYIPFKIKMSFIYKDNFFFAKIGIFCKSIADSLPSVVQAYTQSYSFGERIKLIICQIRHELSVNILEISTSWKKNVRWRILYYVLSFKMPPWFTYLFAFVFVLSHFINNKCCKWICLS